MRWPHLGWHQWHSLVDVDRSSSSNGRTTYSVPLPTTDFRSLESKALLDSGVRSRRSVSVKEGIGTYFACSRIHLHADRYSREHTLIDCLTKRCRVAKIEGG